MPSDYDHIFASFTHAEWVLWYRMGYPFPARVKPAVGEWYVHDRRLAAAPSQNSVKVKAWRDRARHQKRSRGMAA